MILVKELDCSTLRKQRRREEPSDLVWEMKKVTMVTNTIVKKTMIVRLRKQKLMKVMRRATTMRKMTTRSKRRESIQARLKSNWIC